MGFAALLRLPSRRHGAQTTNDLHSRPWAHRAAYPVTNRTLAGSEPARDLIGHVESSGRFPSVLLVLIDDADFGNPGTFGGPIDIPNYTRMGPFGAVPPGRTTVQGIAPRLAGHRPERGGRTQCCPSFPQAPRSA